MGVARSAVTEPVRSIVDVVLGREEVTDPETAERSARVAVDEYPPVEVDRSVDGQDDALLDLSRDQTSEVVSDDSSFL